MVMPLNLERFLPMVEARMRSALFLPYPFSHLFTSNRVTLNLGASHNSLRPFAVLGGMLGPTSTARVDMVSVSRKLSQDPRWRDAGRLFLGIPVGPIMTRYYRCSRPCFSGRAKRQGAGTPELTPEMLSC